MRKRKGTTFRCRRRNGLCDQTLSLDFTFRTCLKPIHRTGERIDFTIDFHSSRKETHNICPFEPSLFVGMTRNSTPILWLLSSHSNAGTSTARKSSCANVNKDESQRIGIIIDQMLRYFVKGNVIFCVVWNAARLTCFRWFHSFALL